MNTLQFNLRFRPCMITPMDLIKSLRPIIDADLDKINIVREGIANERKEAKLINQPIDKERNAMHDMLLAGINEELILRN